MMWTRSTMVTNSCVWCIAPFVTRRGFFAPNVKDIKRQAREQAQSLQWWYRDRYKLPPNDPRFLSLTDADLLLEYWTAYYAAQAAKGEAISFEGEDDDYNLDAILAELEQDSEDSDAWETVIDERS